MIADHTVMIDRIKENNSIFMNLLNGCRIKSPHEKNMSNW